MGNNENENFKKLDNEKIEFSEDVFETAQPIMNEQREQRKLKKYKRKRMSMYMIILLILIVAISIGGGLTYILSDVLGIEEDKEVVEISIEEGATATNISNELEDKGIVKKSIFFRAYLKLFSGDEKFSFGSYRLSKSSSYKSIIETLSDDNNRTDVVTLTFYEGMTQLDIAKKLEENNIVKQDEFYDILKNGEFDYKFIKYLSDDKLIFNKFEGYLFPDTYNFRVGEAPASVAKKFLSNFNKKITDDMYKKMDELGMKLDEVVTLASIVQSEAGGSDEMYGVSSVFENRLKKPADYPKLQSDVTIFYLREDVEPFLENPDDKSNDVLYNAYNTYEKTGLPVGPIGNPGIKAIDSVLNPKDTDYYFFLTDKTGKFYYATTPTQHYRNDQIAKQVNDAIKNK